MFSGYYGAPINRRSAYIPPGGMTAYAHGDMISTNSYVGAQPPPLPHLPAADYAPEEDTYAEHGGQESQHTYSEPEEKPIYEAAETTDEVVKEEVEIPSSTIKPKRLPKKKQKPQIDEEEEEASHDEEEEGDYWPFKKSGRRGMPSYNAFFPIMLGGYSGRGRSGEQDGYPGSATAIANSFSTGKGGVASSHATAYGDPYLSTLLRNGNGLKRKIPADKQE